MKEILVRLLLAAAVTLMAAMLQSSAPAQQADEDPSPATPRQQQTPQSPQRDAAQPSSGDVQTQEALAFTGRLTKDKKRIVLKDPVTKVSYELDDQSKAEAFVGRQVKVVGKLDMNSNTIHIDSIEPLPGSR